MEDNSNNTQQQQPIPSWIVKLYSIWLSIKRIIGLAKDIREEIHDDEQ